MIEKVYTLDEGIDVGALFGSFDSNIKLIEKELNVKILNRGCDIKILGEEKNAENAIKVLDNLGAILSRGEALGEQNVLYTISMVEDGLEQGLGSLGADVVCISSKGKPIKSKTLGQKKYINMIKNNTVTFGIGPAGTGKTYLAVAAAVTAFRNKEVSRIILTRPAVEAGEKLGFLPGDLQMKVDPYLRPLYDAMYDMLGAESYQKYLERSMIEVAPLAYMRGRTLDDAFIILDEAQNTTPEQMKMFLTRIGFGSRAIVTGDITQVDLPDGKKSGLKEASKILKNIEGIDFCYLSEKDVVRHPLVQKIITAYEKAEQDRARRNASREKNY
ncbi:MAG: PhoH family protein [Ruminococcaceae bacterium]|nr:PhoH family protein [Oscillospiraceae bacterium]